MRRMNRVCFVVGLLVVIFIQACGSGPPADMTDPGQLLYFGYTKKAVNCARCHGPEGQGGMQAPDIRASFSKYGEDRIMDFIVEGKGDGKDGMPPMEIELSEAEMHEIIKFVKTLQVDRIPAF